MKEFGRESLVWSIKLTQNYFKELKVTSNQINLYYYLNNHFPNIKLNHTKVPI